MIWAVIFAAFLAIFIYSLKYKVSGFEKVCTLIESLNQDQKELLALHSCVFNVPVRESVHELLKYTEKSKNPKEALAEYFSLHHMRELREFRQEEKEERYSGVLELGGMILELIYCLEHVDMYPSYSPLKWFYLFRINRSFVRTAEVISGLDTHDGKKVVQRKLEKLLQKSRENIKAGNYEQAFEDLDNLYELGISL